MNRGQYDNSAVKEMIARYPPGRLDSLRGEEEHRFANRNPEAQWQWDRERDAAAAAAAKGTDLLPPHVYNEGQGTEASRSLFQSPGLDSKASLEKQGNRDPRIQTRQDEMELGYEDNTLPQTLEGLEQKFFQDIMKLTKELADAEDKENARHRERISEINTDYQEKLLAVRARQATHREEFLRKESETRNQQYQQASIKSYQNIAGPRDPRGYGSAAPADTAGDAHRAYAGGHYDSYGGQPDYIRGLGVREFDLRGQYPGGRPYGSGGRYF